MRPRSSLQNRVNPTSRSHSKRWSSFPLQSKSSNSLGWSSGWFPKRSLESRRLPKKDTFWLKYIHNYIVVLDANLQQDIPTDDIKLECPWLSLRMRTRHSILLQYSTPLCLHGTRYHWLNEQLPPVNMDSCGPIHHLLQYSQECHHRAAQLRHMGALVHQLGHTDIQLCSQGKLKKI